MNAREKLKRMMAEERWYVREKLKRRMAEERWYGSKEHFRTEKSFEEHQEDLKRKVRAKRNPFKLPTIKELMRM